jgi:Ca-activated chloride channel family protein
MSLRRFAPILLLASAQTAVHAGWFTNQEQDAHKAFQSGDFKAAAEGFSDPYRRGVALYRSGRYQEAAQSFGQVQREAVEEDARYNLGNARFQLGDYPGAVQAYETVLQSNPGHQDARYNLTIARALLAQLEQKQFEETKQEKDEQKSKDEKQEQQQQQQQQQQDQDQQKQDQQDQQQPQDQEGAQPTPTPTAAQGAEPTPTPDPNQAVFAALDRAEAEARDALRSPTPAAGKVEKDW